MKYVYALSTLVLTFLFFTLFSLPDRSLHIIACSVGQGDAILLTQKSTQVLIDGGPNNDVLSCLSKHMPFWDKEIELVVLTHPQTDHFTGLIEVFKNYQVDYFLENETKVSTQSYQVLKKVIGGSTTSVINPYTGLRLGNSLFYLDILHPPSDFNSERDINDYSIVLGLYFKNFSGLFTGDIEDKYSKLAATGLITKMNYLKVPHHGSKNGLTKDLLEAVSPDIAVISLGKNNRYGHPHLETLTLLNEKGIRILRTDEIGDVEVITDGDKWWVE